jgi:hypothetical protein
LCYKLSQCGNRKSNRAGIVFNNRGFVDYVATRRNLRQRGRPKKSALLKKIHMSWRVSADEYKELFLIHKKHERRKGAG